MRVFRFAKTRTQYKISELIHSLSFFFVKAKRKKGIENNQFLIRFPEIDFIVVNSF